MVGRSGGSFGSFEGLEDLPEIQTPSRRRPVFAAWWQRRRFPRRNPRRPRCRCGFRRRSLAERPTRNDVRHHDEVPRQSAVSPVSSSTSPTHTVFSTRLHRRRNSHSVILNRSVSLSGVVVNALWLSDPRVRCSHPGPATILLGSNLGQVVYSYCLPSLLSSKKLGYKREYSDWTDLTA